MSTCPPDPLVRRLVPADADALRNLRLQALAKSPSAFTADLGEEAALPLATFAGWVAPDSATAVFGVLAGDALVGMAGFSAAARAKERHKGVLWGVYLAEGWRGHNLGVRLVAAVIAHARGRVLQLQAGVGIANTAARRVYHGLGFVPYGVEPKALRVDGHFIDEELLVLDLEGS